MAKLTQRELLDNLRELIEGAVEDGVADYGDTDSFNVVGMVISPNLDEVIAVADDDAAFLKLISTHKGWHVETASSYDEVLEIADKYVDLR